MRSGKTLIGRTERIDLPKLGFERVGAKLDTGAYTSALHYHSLEERTTEAGTVLAVKLRLGRSRVTMLFKRYKQAWVRNSSGQEEERYVINTTVRLGQHTVRTEFTLSDRSDMKYPVLLGRKFLTGRFIVDVEKRYVLG